MRESKPVVTSGFVRGRCVVPPASCTRFSLNFKRRRGNWCPSAGSEDQCRPCKVQAPQIHAYERVAGIEKKASPSRRKFLAKFDGNQYMDWSLCSCKDFAHNAQTKLLTNFRAQHQQDEARALRASPESRLAQTPMWHRHVQWSQDH